MRLLLEHLLRSLGECTPLPPWPLGVKVAVWKCHFHGTVICFVNNKCPNILFHFFINYFTLNFIYLLFLSLVMLACTFCTFLNCKHFAYAIDTYVFLDINVCRVWKQENMELPRCMNCATQIQLHCFSLNAKFNMQTRPCIEFCIKPHIKIVNLFAQVVISLTEKWKEYEGNTYHTMKRVTKWYN